MKETLKTDELLFEVTRREDGTHILNVYSKYDESMFVESYLSDREMGALIKMLTRVNLGLKQY